jgi:hypothetical protein
VLNECSFRMGVSDQPEPISKNLQIVQYLPKTVRELVTIDHSVER